MAFWWTGRGFLALLTLIGVFGAFGALITFTLGDATFERAPWLWGLGWILAAGVNWYAGCRLNHRPFDPRKGWTHGRLVYRGARNRFMSFPLEFWSVPAMVLAVFLIVRGLLPGAI